MHSCDAGSSSPLALRVARSPVALRLVLFFSFVMFSFVVKGSTRLCPAIGLCFAIIARHFSTRTRERRSSKRGAKYCSAWCPRRLYLRYV